MGILIFLRNKKIWTILFYCYVKSICRLNCALNRNLSAQCYWQKMNNFNKRNSQIDRRDGSMKQAVVTVCVLAMLLVKRGLSCLGLQDVSLVSCLSMIAMCLKQKWAHTFWKYGCILPSCRKSSFLVILSPLETLGFKIFVKMKLNERAIYFSSHTHISAH